MIEVISLDKLELSDDQVKYCRDCPRPLPVFEHPIGADHPIRKSQELAYSLVEGYVLHVWRDFVVSEDQVTIFGSLVWEIRKDDEVTYCATGVLTLVDAVTSARDVQLGEYVGSDDQGDNYICRPSDLLDSFSALIAQVKDDGEPDWHTRFDQLVKKEFRYQRF